MKPKDLSGFCVGRSDWIRTITEPNHNNVSQGFDIIIDVSKHLNAATEHFSLTIITGIVHNQHLRLFRFNKLSVVNNLVTAFNMAAEPFTGASVAGKDVTACGHFHVSLAVYRRILRRS